MALIHNNPGLALLLHYHHYQPAWARLPMINLLRLLQIAATSLFNTIQIFINSLFYSKNSWSSEVTICLQKCPFPLSALRSSYYGPPQKSS